MLKKIRWLTIFRNDGGAPMDVWADTTELAINDPVSSLANLNEVLQKLPALERLVFYVTDYGKVDSTTSLSFLHGVKGLKSLTLCSMPHLRECAPLHECRILESLSLNRHVTTVFDFSVLSSISSLRALSVELPSNAILEKVSKISQLTSLQALGGFKLPSLRPLSGLANLRHLKLWSGALTSTDGLAEFAELEVLNLGHSKLKDTRELGRATGLKKLELVGNKAVSNLDFLEDGALEVLGMYEIPKLDSFKPISRLSRLKEIRSSAKIADSDLLPLVTHPSLEKVTLPGRYKAQLKEIRVDSACTFKVGREILRLTKNGALVLETAGEAKERLLKKLEGVD